MVFYRRSTRPGVNVTHLPIQLSMANLYMTIINLSFYPICRSQVHATRSRSPLVSFAQPCGIVYAWISPTSIGWRCSLSRAKTWNDFKGHESCCQGLLYCGFLDYSPCSDRLSKHMANSPSVRRIYLPNLPPTCFHYSDVIPQRALLPIELPQHPILSSENP